MNFKFMTARITDSAFISGWILGLGGKILEYPEDSFIRLDRVVELFFYRDN